MLDTLTYVRRLKAAGFTEAQADALREIIVPMLATKQDLKDLEHRLMNTLTVRFGLMLTAMVGILLVLIERL